VEHIKSASDEEVIDRPPEKKGKPPKPPKRFKVIYHNDDFTPMEFVTWTLIEYFNKSEKNITETAEKWEKEHKLPDSIAEIVHNQVLARGSFEVLNIAKKLNLPPPFKIEIPQIKIGKKGAVSKNKDTSPEVA